MFFYVCYWGMWLAYLLFQFVRGRQNAEGRVWTGDNSVFSRALSQAELPRQLLGWFRLLFDVFHTYLRFLKKIKLSFWQTYSKSTSSRDLTSSGLSVTFTLDSVLCFESVFSIFTDFADISGSQKKICEVAKANRDELISKQNSRVSFFGQKIQVYCFHLWKCGVNLHFSIYLIQIWVCRNLFSLFCV